MKIALLDVKVGTSLKSKFTAVNVRNMILLKKSLRADYICFTKQLNRLIKYDIIIFGFNSIHTETKHTQKFIENHPNAKYFILCGEYEQSDCINLRYVKRNFSIIQNYEGVTRIGLKNQHINTYELNLNLIIAKKPNDIITKKYDCIYYGRWRDGRCSYFKKYIQNGIYLSTSNKNMKKFKHNNCNPKYLSTIKWNDKKETLNLFRYSLYIEDKYTHKVFNNLANRWYEAGFCNNVVFFDVNCWNTINKSEIGQFKEQIKDYIVTDYKTLKDKIDYCNKDFEKHLAIQKTWRFAEQFLRDEMLKELKRIITEK